MKKTIKLTESDLTALVKKILNEVAEEPIITGNRIFGTFGFAEGKSVPSDFNGIPVTSTGVALLTREMAAYIKNSGTLNTLRQFNRNPNFPLPKFITLNVGTSHTGPGETNAAVAQGRLNFLAGIVAKAFSMLGVDASVVKSIIVSNSNAKYQTSNIDRNFDDPSKKKPDSSERFGYISVSEVSTKGLDTKGIQGIQGELNKASSMINTGFLDLVDEDKIVDSLLGLETFSDIKDLDDAIAAQRDSRFNGLESFINTQLFDDNDAIRTIGSHFQRLAVKSNKQGDTVRLVGGKLSIGLGR
jgi:hypothetical protein